jgi:hypothetical protein
LRWGGAGVGGNSEEGLRGVNSVADDPTQTGELRRDGDGVGGNGEEELRGVNADKVYVS